ncbi:hypothetical protein CLERM_663 [Coxiella-like endosymbiont]|nr:hypothetical protein CLERM_663 [Coxiella-like endosymbiont]
MNEMVLKIYIPLNTNVFLKARSTELILVRLANLSGKDFSHFVEKSIDC